MQRFRDLHWPCGTVAWRSRIGEIVKYRYRLSVQDQRSMFPREFLWVTRRWSCLPEYAPIECTNKISIGLKNSLEAFHGNHGYGIDQTNSKCVTICRRSTDTWIEQCGIHRIARLVVAPDESFHCESYSCCGNNKISGWVGNTRRSRVGDHPVVAPTGTVVLIWFALSTVNVALTPPLNWTSVIPTNPLPLITRSSASSWRRTEAADNDCRGFCNCCRGSRRTSVHLQLRQNKGPATSPLISSVVSELPKNKYNRSASRLHSNQWNRCYFHCMETSTCV